MIIRIRRKIKKRIITRMMNLRTITAVKTDSSNNRKGR